ncbi:MAG: ATP-dependent DNA helicase RecG [Chloroflexi bacterium]|nr:ATP-dependent DNA helicase RecG [Chloroflexota bacterium]
MNAALEQLQKVLELEQARGYQDSAVMGGLDRFLPRWVTRAEAGLEPSFLEQGLHYFHLATPGYARMASEERRRWLTGVLRWLAQPNGHPEADATSLGLKVKPTRSKVGFPPGASLDSRVIVAPGIDVRLASRLKRLGVATLRDMLYLLPRRYIDYSQVKPVAQLEVGEEQTIVASVWSAGYKVLGRGLRGSEAVLGDETGNVRAVWYNNPYMAKLLAPNTWVALSGKVSLFRGQKVFQSPDYELDIPSEPIHTRRLVPVYPLTEGLYARTMRRLMKVTVDYWTPRVEDFLPGEVRERVGLSPLSPALAQAHYPDSLAQGEEGRHRLAFDELFLLQLGLLSRKREWREGQASPPLVGGDEGLGRFLASLPFSLTTAQERCWREIREDLGQPKPMGRLLQGEVGSGKTVLAAAGLVLCAAAGFQGALMVPTEVLADQHFRTLSRLLALASVKVENGDDTAVFTLPGSLTLRMSLLKGSQGSKAREEALKQIAQGEVGLVVGTHALIQGAVEFQSLGLVVVDEQHRFGVMQRQALRQKAEASAHLLAMTATPIPRTLALTFYGDMDLSLIDQLPPGRKPVKTLMLGPQDRRRAHELLRQQVAAGYQAFVLCPLIEGSEAIQARAATEEYEHLRQVVFPDLRLGLLHGRLSGAEKEEVMLRFSQGDLDILVATPVVEVGVDVPGASAILIEGAERFGLAQLHQLRGRVGRGGQPGYCILMAEEPSPEARERLSVLERVHDGLALAEEDLRLRGPGDFLGTRQSGLPQLRLARLSDVALLEMARREAQQVFQRDPTLQAPEHQALGRELARVWSSGITEA